MRKLQIPKCIAALTACLLTAVPVLPVSTNAESQKFTVTDESIHNVDFDGDSSATVIDMLYLLKVLSKVISPEDISGDFNLDGVTDVSDVSALRMYLSGYEEEVRTGTADASLGLRVSSWLAEPDVVAVSVSVASLPAETQLGCISGSLLWNDAAFCADEYNVENSSDTYLFHDQEGNFAVSFHGEDLAEGDELFVCYLNGNGREVTASLGCNLVFVQACVSSGEKFSDIIIETDEMELPETTEPYCPTDVQLVSMPEKTVYQIGEELDLSGCVVRVSSPAFSAFELDLSDPDNRQYLDTTSFNSGQAGTYWIKVSVYGEEISFPVEVTEPETKPVVGDVDGDGETEVLDVIALTQYLLGSDTAIQAESADLNADGNLDVFDLGLLKRLLLQK